MAQLEDRVARLEANQERMVTALGIVVETQRDTVARMDTMVARMDALAATQQAMLEILTEQGAILGQVVETQGSILKTQDGILQTQERILSKLIEHDTEFTLLKNYLRRDET